MCDAANAFATKDNQKVLQGLQKIRADLPLFKQYVSACPADVQADFAAVGTWYKSWMAQGEMQIYQNAYKNVLHNMATIKADANTIDADWHANDFVGVGEMAGEIAKIALPVTSENDICCNDANCCTVSQCGSCPSFQEFVQ